MGKLDLLNGYVEWARERSLYPSRHEPEDYLEYLQNMRNRAILERIATLLESELEPEDLLLEIASAIEDETE